MGADGVNLNKFLGRRDSFLGWLDLNGRRSEVEDKTNALMR